MREGESQKGMETDGRWGETKSDRERWKRERVGDRDRLEGGQKQKLTDKQKKFKNVSAKRRNNSASSI